MTSAREPVDGPLVELHRAQGWWRATARQHGQRPTARLSEMLAKEVDWVPPLLIQSNHFEGEGGGKE